MKTSFELITPVKAAELLKKNNMNRLLRKNDLNEYARQMVAGLWKEETGEAIKIADDNTILDGQHRLQALILANISLRFMVITGLDKSVFTVLDSGIKRSSGDILHIAGIHDSNNVAAGIRKYVILKSGRVLGRTTNASTKYSSSEILSAYLSRIKFWDAATLMSNQWYDKSKRILPKSEFMGLYAFLFDIHPDDAFVFMSSLADGLNLESNNPIYLLREKLLMAKLNTRFNLLNTIKTALIIKAWNAFRNKQTFKILKYDIERDNYPVAI